jgi:hypothetical protein
VICRCAEELAGDPDPLAQRLSRATNLVRNVRTKPIDYDKTILASDLNYGGRLMEAILTQAQKDCMSKQCRLVIVSLPDPKNYADPRESGVLERCAGELSIPYADLKPTFTQLENTPHKPVFFTAHYTAEGHRIIAEQLAAFLAKEGVVR